MLLVIVGKLATGKTTLANNLINHASFERIITYTTRAPRPGEENGKDYHFVSKEVFLDMQSRELFAEVSTSMLGGELVYYGSTYEAYRQKGNHVVVLDPKGAFRLKKHNIDCKILYLRATDDTCINRALGRGMDYTEVTDRMMADRDVFDSFEKHMIWDDMVQVDEFNANEVLVYTIDKVNHWSREKS